MRSKPVHPAERLSNWGHQLMQKVNRRLKIIYLVDNDTYGFPPKNTLHRVGDSLLCDYRTSIKNFQRFSL